MAFIRTKKINGKEYAYLAENRWLKTKKQPKQKVRAYLGRVISPDIKEEMEDISFYDYKGVHDAESYVSEKSREDIIQDLIRFEIKKHECGNIKFMHDKGSLKSKNRNVVLKINDGFLCSHTIQELLSLQSQGDEEEFGIELAKAFVNAGIAVPREIFVGFFSKIFK